LAAKYKGNSKVVFGMSKCPPYPTPFYPSIVISLPCFMIISRYSFVLTFSLYVTRTDRWTRPHERTPRSGRLNLGGIHASRCQCYPSCWSYYPDYLVGWYRLYSSSRLHCGYRQPPSREYCSTSSFSLRLTPPYFLTRINLLSYPGIIRSSYIE
jgi:hypothetical protein